MNEARRVVEVRPWAVGGALEVMLDWDVEDPLERMFGLGRRVLEGLRERKTPFAMGKITGVDAGAWLEEIDARHPVAMESPFEGCEDVAGGVWRGEGRDAILRLRFHPGAEELPAHVHEFSDRVLVAVEGEGRFHASRDTLETFSGRIESWNVGPGSVIAFRRGLVHTFNAGPDGLTLLSFHNPFFALDEPRQYTLPRFRWTVGCCSNH